MKINKSGDLISPASVYAKAIKGNVYTDINKDNFLEIYNKMMNGERVCYYYKNETNNYVEKVMTAVSAADYDDLKIIIFCCATTSNVPEDQGEPYFVAHYYDGNAVKRKEFNFVDLYLKYVCPVGTLSFKEVGNPPYDSTWEPLTWNIDGTSYTVYKRTK